MGKNSDDLYLLQFFSSQILLARACLGGRTYNLYLSEHPSQKLVDRGKITPQGNHLVIPLSTSIRSNFKTLLVDITSFKSGRFVLPIVQVDSYPNNCTKWMGMLFLLFWENLFKNVANTSLDYIADPGSDRRMRYRV